MTATHSQRAAVGVDGAPLRRFLARVAEELLHPWRFLSIDFTRKDGPIAQSERFEAEKALAASGVNGCRRAQHRVRNATLRGLEQATGKHLPPVCFR